MTATRGLVGGALAIAVVVIAVLLLSGGATHHYTLLFPNAGQLVKGDDVQIGGHRVGNVDDIKLARDNQAEVDISVQDAFAPLHDGTTALIRATSLSGIANRYITLDPGPNNMRELADGAVIPADRTTSPVDLDQLFDTFDPATRRNLQKVIHGSAQQYIGQGAAANRNVHYFNPFLSTTSRLVNELVSDQPAFERFVTQSSKVVTSLAARRDRLSALVADANTTASAVGSERRALSTALGELPGTLRRANTTFVNLRATLNDLDTLVTASKPATKRLAPFLAALRPLVADARPTIADLRRLIRRKGANNDLIELLRKTPRLERVAKPTFADSIQALQKSTPVLKFIRPYAPELVGWIRDFGQGSSNYDANGHFARIQPIFDAFDLNDNVLTPQPANARIDGFQSGIDRRCPGTATQSPADNSLPFRDVDGSLDCDTNDTLPGP